MAFMDQNKKKEIAAELKKVVPKGWKYSLSVHNHTSITMTIKSAPIDLIGLHKNLSSNVKGHVQLNEFCLDRAYEGELLETMQNIVKALNTGNFDKSDSQTDYFHVGFYADLNLGRWDKDFVVA
jgi:hypothetical protein